MIYDQQRLQQHKIRDEKKAIMLLIPGETARRFISPITQAFRSITASIANTYIVITLLQASYNIPWS